MIQQITHRSKVAITILSTLVALNPLQPVAGSGFAVTLENDIFFDTDGDYTHGTELAWIVDRNSRNYRTIYGIAQAMYTPENVRITMPTSRDRPWAGSLFGFIEQWHAGDTTDTSTRYLVGVIGPASKAGSTQRYIHKLLDCSAPAGWEYQVPNEPLFNIVHTRYTGLMTYRRGGKRIADFTFVHGCAVGTGFDNIDAALRLRIGFNIPERRAEFGLRPKAGDQRATKFFAYATASAGSMLVLHNATINDSMFRHRETWQRRRLEHIVGVCMVGVTAGYDKFVCHYAMEVRSDEFKGQSGRNTNYGTITVGYYHNF